MSSPAEASRTTIEVPRRRTLVERSMDVGSKVLDIRETKEEEVDHDLPRVDPMVEYQKRPLDFLVEKLGIPRNTLVWSENPGYVDEDGFALHEWDGTADPLVAIMDALADGKDACVEAGTGTQKSYTAAALILWFLACFYEARVFTFAPKEEQLRSFIWMEIGKLWPRFKVLFPTAEITDLRIRMRGTRDNAWGAQGYSVGRKAGEDISTKAQGMHAKDMLLVYEETPGIELPVIEAGENTSTAPHNLRLALGNPDHQLDALHLFGFDEFGVPREGVVPIRISALDHPNLVAGNDDIVPGAASTKSVQRRRLKYGTSHRLYRSRIRGISPAEATDALIKLEWIRKAQARWAHPETRKVLEAVGKGKKSLGVDVANSEDGDEAAISKWTGAVCQEVPSFACPNANNLGYDVFLLMNAENIDTDNVGVDGVGVGAGTVNELRNRGKFIRSLVGGSEGSIDEEDWNTLRSQMWWSLAEDLRFDRIALPVDAQLARDLITPTWRTHRGKIIVESKEDIKKRTPGGRSPNKADAVVYGNHVRPRDPVKSDLPKRHPTLPERILKDIQSLEEPPKKPQKNYHVLRQ